MTQTINSALLGQTLAQVLSREGRAEADRTGQFLARNAGAQLPNTSSPGHWDKDIRKLLETSDYAAAAEILAAHACVPWGENPVANRVTEDFSRVYSVATLMGPEGPILCPDLRCGLFYQRPNCYYALHSHEAVETYVILAGTATWTVGRGTGKRQAGDIIHHPSNTPHAFRTGDQGFVALWRWSGDITVDSFQMLDDPNGKSGPMSMDTPRPELS